MTLALVTGGTGFIGSNLALRLVERAAAASRENWRVRILERPGADRSVLEGGPFEFVSGDLLAPETLPAALQDVDIVFHAAGVVDYWRQGVDRMYAVNVDGTRHLVQAALACGVRRFVHVSSAAALGIHPDALVDETFSFNVSPQRFVYGHSKYQAEQIVLEAVRSGLPAVIVNPTSVIGPRDVHKLSSGKVIEVAQHCLPPLIPPGGLNVIPICDVAQGIIETALKGCIGERYLLAGENMTHLQFYRTIANVVGCSKKIKAMPRWQVTLFAALTDMLQPQTSGPTPLTGDRLRLESQTFYFDGTKARSTFKMPNTPLRITIGRTKEWYELTGELPCEAHQEAEMKAHNT